MTEPASTTSTPSVPSDESTRFLPEMRKNSSSSLVSTTSNSSMALGGNGKMSIRKGEVYCLELRRSSAYVMERGSDWEKTAVHSLVSEGFSFFV